MCSQIARESFDREIARVALRQHGVISRRQALQLSPSRSVLQSRLSSGRWETLHPGVYRIAGAPSSWRQSLMAACFAAGGVASHRSAGRLWTLPGFRAALIELIVAGDRGRRKNMIVHRASSLPSVDVTTVDGIPVTTPARTLIDLAAIESIATVEDALDDALRRKLVSLARLRWRVDELTTKGRPGTSAMRGLLEGRMSGADVPQSVFETRLLRLFKRSGLPSPEIQYEIRIAGRLVARVDFAFPEQRAVVEADGYRWHSSRSHWDRDIMRLNDIMALGWHVERVTWRDMTERPEETAARIGKALSRRIG